MAVTRHLPTLILPDLPKQALVGIDFLSLTASQRFNGFTSLPSGWHFLFVGQTTELSSRQGLWFYVPELGEDSGGRSGQKRARADSQPLGVRGTILPSMSDLVSSKDWLAVLEWDAESETLQSVKTDAELGQWRQRLLSSTDLQKTLFPYRQSVQPEQRIQEVEADEESEVRPPVELVAMTDRITPRLLTRICGDPREDFWILDTASSSRVDAEAENIPGLEGNERFHDQALGLVDVNLKRSWAENAIGRERTEGARDRSWLLNDVVERLSTTAANKSAHNASEIQTVEWGLELLGEMQFCFISILTLANWSCMAHWRRILELVLTCHAIIAQQPAFFASFLTLLAVQLTHTSLVEGGLFDVKDDGGAFLHNLLRRFHKSLAEMGNEKDLSTVRREMSRLQDTVKDIWGWELGNEWARRGMVQLEDGEMVELETQEMEDEDERGEYAPVIVDLD